MRDLGEDANKILKSMLQKIFYEIGTFKQDVRIYSLTAQKILAPHAGLCEVGHTASTLECRCYFEPK